MLPFCGKVVGKKGKFQNALSSWVVCSLAREVFIGRSHYKLAVGAYFS